MSPSEKRARLAVLATIALGVSLSLPALGAGFYHDDYFHFLILENVLPATGWSDLYRVVPGWPNSAGPTQGDYLPWWSASPSLEYFRPIASLSLLLDRALHGRKAAPGFHATNLVLWAIVLFVAWRLYRALAEKLNTPNAPNATAAVALLLLAVSKTHVLPAAWISDRHTLLAASFTTAALLVLIRGVASMRESIAFTALTACALLSSEQALGLTGWLIAYVVCVARGTWRARLTPIVGALAILVAYLVFYKAMGFGAKWPTLYVDPLREPVAFAIAAFRRVPYLLIGLLTPLPCPPDLKVGTGLGFLAGTLNGPLGITLGYSLAAALVLIHRRELREEPLVRFLVLGTFLSLIPLVTTEARDRLLLMPSVGVSFLYARLITDAVTRPSFERRAVAAGLVLAAALSAWLTLRWTRFFAEESRYQARIGESVDKVIAPATRPPFVLLVNAPLGTWTSLPMYRAAAGRPIAAGIWQLSLGQGMTKLTRTGPKTLEVDLPPPGLLAIESESMWRCGIPMREGEVFQKGALKVRVRSMSGPNVTRVEVELDRDLDAEDVWLLAYRGHRYERVKSPSLAGSVALDGR